jgi:hypothetical protein
MESKYFGRPIPELVAEVSRQPLASSKDHAEVHAALHAGLVSQLTSSIDAHQKAATRLSVQLLVLNIILGFFTVAGTALAVAGFFPSKP